jgi:hypothetical protein
MSKRVASVQEIAYHRNGIGGNGFYAVRFTSDIEPDSEAEAKLCQILGQPAESGVIGANFIGIVFDEPGSCAVLCLDRLESHGVRFAGGNSWRGDQFEPELRAAIEAQNGSHSGGVRVGPFCVPTPPSG